VRMPWFGVGFKEEWARSWIERAQSCWDKGPWVLSILDEDDHYLGALALMRIEKDRSIEVAYWVLAEHRNNGVARRAIAAAMDWALAHLDATRFWAKTAPANRASQRALLASGFVLVAEDERGAYFDWMKRARSST